MKKIITIISAFTVVVMAFGLFTTVAEANLGSNNSSGTGASLSSNNSDGTESGSGLSANNSSGTEGSDLSSNNSDGTESSGDLGSNNSDGTENSGGLSPNNSSGTEGSTSGNGGNGGNDGSGSNSSRRSSGGSSIVRAQISDVTIENIGSNMIRVTWNTSLASTGRLVYGLVSTEANSKIRNYGYESTSITSEVKSKTHAFAMIVNPGTVYFIRPVAINGSVVTFGEEIAIVKNAVLTQNVTRPASEVVTIGGNTDIYSEIDITPSTSTDEEVTDESEDEANVVASNSSFVQKVINFFKKIWSFLVGQR